MDIKDYQKKLFPYAYNILGTYNDAQDAVQDVITKYYSTVKPGVENPVNYLIKGVINQAINLKKRNGKLIGAGILLPEPISTENADSDIVRKEIASYSLMVLLDSVNAKERAVFILKEGFDYSHEEIADALGISVQNSRKLLSRAKIKLGEAKENPIKSPLSNTTALENYIHALKNGDVESLERMLVKDISVMVDGGSMQIVSPFETGINNVIRLMTSVYRTYQTTAEIRTALVNHQPALLFYLDGRLVNCQVFAFEEDTALIAAIYSIVDPEKLKNFAKVQ